MGRHIKHKKIINECEIIFNYRVYDNTNLVILNFYESWYII